MSKEIRIGKHFLGLEHPVYFIADIAANHEGDIERAKELIHECAEAGASAAKFQHFSAHTIVSDRGFRELGGTKSHQANWKRSIFEVYQDASIPLEWTQTLKETCDKAGVDFFTAPYDLAIIDELSPFVCGWKLGSGDITWHEEIERLAKGGKPLLIATGAADMSEVQAAVQVAERYCDDLVIMQCNTNYTASLENFHHIALNVLRNYSRTFPNVLLGLSDHTPGHATVLGAIALGARAVEKHFTDDMSREGPDHAFSMDPTTWKEMVDRSRELEAALGSEEKRVMDNESETVVLQRRSIRARYDIPVGHTLTREDVIPLRPCPSNALPPYRIQDILGRKTRRAIETEECILLADLN